MGNSQAKEAQQEFRKNLIDGSDLKTIDESFEKVKRLIPEIQHITQWVESSKYFETKDTKNALHVVLSDDTLAHGSNRVETAMQAVHNKLDFFNKYRKEFADAGLINDQKNDRKKSIVHRLITLLVPFQTSNKKQTHYQQKKEYTLKWLIEEVCLDGASLNLVEDEENRTPLMQFCAAYFVDNEYRKSQEAADFIEMLLSNGANETIDAVDKLGKTAIMLAAENKFDAAIKELAPISSFNKVPDLDRRRIANLENFDSNRQPPNQLTFFTDPLLEALHGNCDLDVVSTILSRCPPDVRKTSYYDPEGDTSNFKQKIIAYTPLRIAVSKKNQHLFDFLINNNFDLSDSKYLSSINGGLKLEDVGHPGHYLGNKNGLYDQNHQKTLLVKLAGTSALAQAALLQQFFLFDKLIMSFDPRMPCSQLPNKCSVLHIIASYAPQGDNKKIDHAVDFVDLIRDKCQKYSQGGAYDWYVKDDQGKTPLDYCIDCNEISGPVDDDDELPPPPPPGSAPPVPLTLVDQVIHVSRTFTSLVLIETLKHNNENKKYHFKLRSPSSECATIITFAPTVLAESVLRLTIDGNTSNTEINKMSGVFTKLEVLELVDCNSVTLRGIFADVRLEDGAKAPAIENPWKRSLKKIIVKNCAMIEEKAVKRLETESRDVVYEGKKKGSRFKKPKAAAKKEKYEKKENHEKKHDKFFNLDSSSDEDN